MRGVLNAMRLNSVLLVNNNTQCEIEVLLMKFFSSKWLIRCFKLLHNLQSIRGI